MYNNKNKELLQSQQWQDFQRASGRKTFHLENEDFLASIIQHQLPMVGRYFYCPRGPKIEIQNPKSKIQKQLTEFIDLAKKENAGWIRIEPCTGEMLEIIKENVVEKIIKAPHDMQPKEVFVVDISKTEEQLLSEMKPKTRYNINLAKKKGITISNSSLVSGKAEKEVYINEFLKLTKDMAARQGITTHAEQYYRKMIETFPQDMLKIYVAQFDGKIIAANLVLFYGDTATYLHGASGNEHRNLMAPFFLQWQTILDAKEKGYTKYDFGGVKTHGASAWEGITNFKIGFSPNTQPIEFPGSYDIVISPRKYAVYRGLQRAKAFAVRFKK